MSFPKRELAFSGRGVPKHQRLACYKTENRIAQEFKLLVVLVGGARRRAAFEPRPVCQCTLKKFTVAELIV